PGQPTVERGPSVASDPALNQKVATTIAEQLRGSANLRHYTIDVTFHDGTAELNGTIADEPQHEEVLNIVRGVTGVEGIIDHLVSADPSTLKMVQAVTPQGINLPTNMPPNAAPNLGVGPQPQFHTGMAGAYDPRAQPMPGNGFPGYTP